MGDNWKADSWRGNGRNNDFPKPPEDPELRRSIEHTASLCARNGPNLENIMREQQKNNSSFSYLFGGPFSEYYQAMLHYYIQQMQRELDNSHGQPPSLLSMNTAPPSLINPGTPAPPSTVQMDTPEVTEMKHQIDELRQKIMDSESNLKAHQNSLEDMILVHLMKNIRSSEQQKIEQLLNNHNIDVTELCANIDRMSQSKCSKEVISSAKRWIFDNCTTDQLREIILMYLLNRLKDENSSEYLRLHILYVINDWAFHCQRKREDNQMKMLSRYVPKMYAYCIELATSQDLKEKLEGKLVGEWEGRGYFNDSVFKQIRNPFSIVHCDREIEYSSYNHIRESIRSSLMATYDGYEQQHRTFAQHCEQKIEMLNSKIQEIHSGSKSIDNATPNIRRSRFDQTPQERRDDTSVRSFSKIPSRHSTSIEWTEVSESRPPPIADGDDIDGHPFDEQALKPNKSYLALPAGIMVPLINIADFKYEAIDPELIEMPPMVPPSQRLMSAKDSFYKGLNLDNMLTDQPNDDWDIVSYPTEFLERKAALKKVWLEGLLGERKSVEDCITNKPNKQEADILSSEEKRKYNEMVESIKEKVEQFYANEENNEDSMTEKKGSRSRSSSRSTTSSRSRRSASNRSSRSSSSSSSASSSSSRSSSGSPKRRISRSPPRQRFQRSPSPVFSTPAFGFKSSSDGLSSENKGAQLMMKMGWTGKGLGANESGITTPVNGGEVRDKIDQFRGLGSSLDPYEQFRKQRSGSYHEKGSMLKRL